MSNTPLCTPQEIQDLVHDFYGRVRKDGSLGPIFDRHLHDWDAHLAIMVRFWSSLLLGTGEYQGSPMTKHIALPNLSAPLFEHWLDLFHQTTRDQPNAAMARKAEEFSQRIARSLWYGYQMNHDPDQMTLTEIRHG